MLEAPQVSVKEKDLEKALGTSAYEVWQMLCSPRCRRQHLISYTSTAVLKSHLKGMSIDDVKHAMKKLKDAGLIKNLQPYWRWIKDTEDERTQWTTWYKAMPKRVFGIRTKKTEDEITIPIDVKKWMSEKPKWGGKREGAGRKKKIESSTEKESSLPPYIYIDQRSLITYNISNLLRKLEMAKPSVLLRSLDFSSMRKEVSFCKETSSASDLGSRLGSSSTAIPPMFLPGHNGVPRYPGPTVMPPAIIPSPPLLSEDIPDKQAVDKLIKAFRGAVESRYKTPCNHMMNRKIVHSRFYPLLIRAVKALRDLEIAPAAWAAFSVDVWRRYGNENAKKKPPPLNWVFSDKRIVECSEWFANEAGSYVGGRIVFGETAQDLLRRYTQMRLELTRSCATTPEEVAGIVERFFSGTSYDDTIKQACRKAKEDQAIIDGLVADGEWVW